MGLECKHRKSRDTRSNRHIWPWSTKWSRAKANSSVKRIYWSWQTPSCNNTRDDSTNGHHQMVNTKLRLIIFLAAKMKKLYTVSKNKTRSWLWSRSWTPSCKIQTFAKLKKVGRTTRPSSFELNQIPYDYTVEVTNRFKELDLIEYLENYGQRFVILYRRQWSRPSPRKRSAKRQNGCLRRPYK